VSEDFTVRLERVFHGPLDLLLHLVREQEVEIEDVEISTLLETYLAHLESLERLDVEFAADFLVMAATLMAIKSRSLLPREEVDLEDDLDPRDELIQRLLEYKRYKESSQSLEDMASEREQLHERGWRGEVKAHETEPELELGEITPWDLLAHFSRLMRETRTDHAHHIQMDARPMRFYVERMASIVQSKERVSLREIVDAVAGGPPRETLVGSFCALLELVKMGLVQVTQEEDSDEISLELSPEHADDIDDVLRASKLEDEEDDGLDEGLESPEPNVEVPRPEPAPEQGA
jgi:segregation and condensation protein A